MAQLDPQAFRVWVARARRALDAHRDELNRLNVFPVPDGDTGTNLCVTWQAVARAVEEAATATTVGTLARVAARGALMSARGNSGVIVAQFLGGLASALAGLDTADGSALAVALLRGATEVEAAVARPAEGTAITVLRVAAEAAMTGGDDAVLVMGSASAAAALAVAATTGQNDVLRAAGVIDAGGKGIAVIIDALTAALLGGQETAAVTSVASAPAPEPVGQSSLAYEVTYLLDAPSAAVTKLRERLLPLGDSLVIAGGEGLWNVHVHVDDVAAAIEAGIDAGRPHRLTVTRFADAPGHVEPVQVADDFRTPDAPDEYAEEAAPTPRRTVIAVADGHGTATLFTELGARVIPGPLPSATDLVRAIELTDADEVVLFGSDPRMVSVVKAAAESARTSTRTIAIVPTRSPLQGLVALSVSDPERRFPDDVVAMAQAAAACRCGGVSMQGGRAHSTVDGGRAQFAAGVADGAIEVVSRLVQLGGEVITVLLGRDAPPRLGEVVRDAFPAFTVEVLDGGQSDPVVSIGVE